MTGEVKFNCFVGTLYLLPLYDVLYPSLPAVENAEFPYLVLFLVNEESPSY